MLSPESLALALATVAGAGCVTGLTGFGFALVSVPLLMLVMPPASVVAAVLVVGELVDLFNAVTSLEHVDGRVLRNLLPTATVGMVVGSFALANVPVIALKLVSSGLVVLFTFLLIGSPPTWRTHRNRGWTALAGTISGLLTTSVGLSGPPVVLLASAVLPDKNRSRATLAAYFGIIMPVGLVLLVAQGTVPASAWSAIVLLAPAALVGRVVGSRLHRRTPQSWFRRVSLAIILATGIGGVASALVSALAHG